MTTLGITEAELINDAELLKTVLSYHVIPGVAATAADLKDGQKLPTEDGSETITVSKSGGTVKFIPSATNAPEATVVVPDIKAGDAVVHIIDTVLLPANAKPPAKSPSPSPKASPSPSPSPSPRSATAGK